MTPVRDDEVASKVKSVKTLDCEMKGAHEMRKHRVSSCMEKMEILNYPEQTPKATEEPQIVPKHVTKQNPGTAGLTWQCVFGGCPGT